jgi:predicted transglutaminase-like cysteine proteinase
MFGRLVVCGIFFLAFLLTASGGTTFVFADAKSPAASTTAQDREQYRTQDQTNLAAVDPHQRPMRPTVSIEPFGLDAAPVGSGELLAKWRGVQTEIRAEAKILRRCHEIAGPCPAAAQEFLAIVAEGRARTGRARIGVINRAINLAIRPMSDLAQWGVLDRWTAPLATLKTGLGDCKDYAIAKYVALREAGVAEADVRLLIVRNLSADEDHAVVAVRLDGGWIMLDNRWLALVEDTEMRHVVPLFVLDQKGVEQFPMQDARRASSSSEAAAPEPTSLGPRFHR